MVADGISGALRGAWSCYDRALRGLGGTKNLLLGHSKLESTVRCFGMESFQVRHAMSVPKPPVRPCSTKAAFAAHESHRSTNVTGTATMKIVTSLSFRGQCAEAFGFYAKVLGGKITAAIPYGDAPPGMPISDPKYKT